MKIKSLDISLSIYSNKGKFFTLERFEEELEKLFSVNNIKPELFIIGSRIFHEIFWHFRPLEQIENSVFIYKDCHVYLALNDLMLHVVSSGTIYSINILNIEDLEYKNNPFALRVSGKTFPLYR